MKINIAENIRKFRKERSLTQERLAEILGVTVGAVSKWESGASIPELTLIVEMADFFETSVDVLLGYGWHSGSMGDTMAQIKTLRNERRFDEAVAEAEKALERYPNCFEVTFGSAVLYSMRGIERHEQRSFERALRLFERSLELMGQNTDPKINEWSVKNSIAELYISLGQIEKALDIMKKNNVSGLNDGNIGRIIATKKQSPDEALGYLSSALTKGVAELIGLCSGYVEAYTQKKDYASASAVCLRTSEMLEGLRRPDAVSYIDKLLAQCYTTGAVTAALGKDEKGAREQLIKAKDAAQRFDREPTYTFNNIYFHHGNSGTAFDDFGETAVEGVLEVIAQNNDAKEILEKIWEEIQQ